jgi:myo-inositol 2-dehydrogenase/D-chiro-inositol 1-dehydrogenase
MKTGRTPRRIGLAIVGAGRIGLIRGEIAARHGNVDWIGVAETRADRGITPEDERV